MRPRNNASLPAFFLLISLFVVTSEAQSAAPNPSSAAPAATSQAPANSPAPSQPPAANPAQNPDSSANGVFVFHKDVEEVVLHATVIDDKQRIVTTLSKEDFKVYENGHL